MAQLQPLLQDLIKQGIADAVDFFFFPNDTSNCTEHICSFSVL